MNTNIPSLDALVAAFSKLPSIGRKTAMRLALHVLRGSDEDAGELSEAVMKVRSQVKLCCECFHFCEGERCVICESGYRRGEIICVVEEPGDIMVIEENGSYDGRYHVLHGRLSPMDGIGPDTLRIKELLDRIKKQKVDEIILALGSSLEGDATALYLRNVLKPLEVKVSRIAHGIPVGTNLEFIDQRTLASAIQNRQDM